MLVSSHLLLAPSFIAPPLLAIALAPLLFLIVLTGRFGWTALHWATECDPAVEEPAVVDRKYQILKLVRASSQTIPWVEACFQMLDCNSHFNPAVKTQRGNTALVHTIWNGNLKSCQVRRAPVWSPTLTNRSNLSADLEEEGMRSEYQDRVTSPSRLCGLVHMPSSNRFGWNAMHWACNGKQLKDGRWRPFVEIVQL